MKVIFIITPVTLTWHSSFLLLNWLLIHHYSILF
nr:MAG TPA: hypothetical protein [Bacteriophage sp.]